MKVWMKAPVHSSVIAYQCEIYRVNADGFVLVPVSAISVLAANGFRQAKANEVAKPKRGRPRKHSSESDDAADDC